MRDKALYINKGSIQLDKAMTEVCVPHVSAVCHLQYGDETSLSSLGWGSSFVQDVQITSEIIEIIIF